MFDGLRTRLAGGGVLVLALVLVVLAAVAFVMVRGQAIATLDADMHHLGQSYASNISQWLHGKQAITHSLKPAVDADNPIPLLRAAEQSGVDLAYFVRADGSYAFTREQAPDYQGTQRAWYKQAVAAGGPVMTQVYKDDPTGYLTISFAEPVIKNGKAIAVVGTDVKVASLIRKIGRIKPYKNSFAFLVNAETGNVIAYPAAKQALRPVSRLSSGNALPNLKQLSVTGQHKEVVVDGTRRFLYASAVPGWPWLLGISIDKATALSIVREFSWLATTIALIGIAVAGVLIILFMRMRALALRDSLTQLPNRRLLLKRLDKAIDQCRRTGHKAALMMLDLDHFKNLNDSLGHDNADTLIKQLAARMAQSMARGDTVARFGGDEFMLVINGLDFDCEIAVDQAEKKANALLAQLREPYDLGNASYRMSQSIGMVMFGFPNDEPDRLFRQVDATMYEAKRAGRNQVHIFDPVAQKRANYMTRLATDMHAGLAAGEFTVHYQGQVDANGELTGAETLARWQHPQFGMVSPADFIPLAEQSGFIHELGSHVLETACRQLVTWRDDPRTAYLRLAVNVSAKQFYHPDFVGNTKRILERTGASPHQLVLELTESMLVSDTDKTAARMGALQRCGITFSMDDFGTGYASLDALRRLPIVELKIDQGFVRDVHENNDSATIVRTIMALARAMHLSTIAEGVETRAERDFLASEGCQGYQGYFYCKPQPIQAFETMLKKNAGKDVGAEAAL